MVKLTPAEPNEIQNGLRQSLKQWQSGVTLEPNALVLKGYEDDELIAVVILKFHLDGSAEPYGTAEIEKIVWKNRTKALADKELCFIIGNGILNFIDRRGIRMVYCCDMENKSILSLLRFEYDKESDRFCLDLTGYFEHKCGGG